MNKVSTGLDILISSKDYQDKIKGNIAYLGNQASVTRTLENGLEALVGIFGKRVVKAFGPQHGFASSAQDNMIESPHSIHPLYKIPIFSLYSETRKPNDEMLEGIGTLIIDLQDVGTRVYTYIWTLYHIMEAAESTDINIVILDRPNPVGGMAVQGNLPEPEYYSFVCRSNIPMRHGMTIGEIAQWIKKYHFPETCLELIRMENWDRRMLWKDTGLYWLNPSPNLPTPEGSLVYPGSVLFEGTVLSEGRGTTRSLELFGHPVLDPHKWKAELDAFLGKSGSAGQVLRPVYFEPVFQKFKNQVCGGYQVHITDPDTCNPWRLGQLLLHFLYRRLDLKEFWSVDPYEYEFDGLAIDWINGTENIRGWVEKEGDIEELEALGKSGLEDYLQARGELLLY